MPHRIAEQQKLHRFSRRDFQIALSIMLAHIPVGILLYRVPNFGVVLPLSVFALGLYWASQRRFALDRIGLIAGYLIGSEVLWRMAHVPIYWEFGKYATAAIMITALVVRRRFRLPGTVLIYGLLLIPACVTTLLVMSLTEARNVISSNMSGPFALVISCWFFANFKVNSVRLRRLVYSMMIPLFSVAIATLFYTVSAEDIQFTTESNFATSGGFGPNQVSAMLGLGAFLAASCIVLFKYRQWQKIALGIIALVFAAQSVMTFSRGGMYNALGALVVLIVFWFRRPIDGLAQAAPVLAAVLLFFVLVFPYLNNFTGGKLEERFAETETTHRLDIMWSDFEIFQENPVLGAGVGVSRHDRERFLEYSALSHTEFTRLISEHGSFGFAALAALLSMIVMNFKKQKYILRKAFVMGVSTWCILFMLNAGMRLAAPSFLWGLTFLTILKDLPPRRLTDHFRRPCRWLELCESPAPGPLTNPAP